MENVHQNDDAHRLLFEWMSFAGRQQRVITSIINSLGSISRFTEEKALELSYQFQVLSTLASEQTKHLQNLTHMAKMVSVNNEEIEITTLSKRLQKTYIDSVGSIIEVSKQAVVMACIQDESLSTLKLIEKSIREIEQINNKTKYLSLNATIESIRAGEAGQSFQVVANEVRELSEDTQQMAVNIRTQVNEMTKILGHAQEILQDITSLDMNKHIMAKDQIDDMISGLLKKNTHMGKITGEVSESMHNFSKSAAQLVMSLQYQDRIKQDIMVIISKLQDTQHYFMGLDQKTKRVLDGQRIDWNEEAMDTSISLSQIKTTYDIEDPMRCPLSSQEEASRSNGEVELF
jgi:methyl-accepting chemotaxis protein